MRRPARRRSGHGLRHRSVQPYVGLGLADAAGRLDPAHRSAEIRGRPASTGLASGCRRRGTERSAMTAGVPSSVRTTTSNSPAGGRPRSSATTCGIGGGPGRPRVRPRAARSLPEFEGRGHPGPEARRTGSATRRQARRARCPATGHPDRRGVGAARGSPGSGDMSGASAGATKG